ncbi:uncharacterized protein ACA1_189610 [Acanthamoeba castellanii str. Neff]|uniref:Mitochondrial glycoprotein n=1 Tax=Acanthamoeba castellanii (strain ATCC 30010 / Neff) TaxID=1257118 RepID=L8GDW2_ACACF|nr:uncharacterized protein ACA1_189610 [Acanthamoeba castellanii str. Neff]ELR11295.1 hypothetical protein ACA1_189610 [Acanthamoeba castellanii str. Neff]
MRRFSSSIVASGRIASSSALVRTAVLGQGRLAATYATKKRNAETELHSYFEKEVELLDQDEEAKTQDQELQKRLDDWAKRFHFNVNMGATEIVATKKDAALNADVTVKIDPNIEEADNYGDEEDAEDEEGEEGEDAEEAEKAEGEEGDEGDEEEEEPEADGFGSVHFTVEVKKPEQTMLLYGVVSESAVTVTEVALQAADGTEKSAYDAQRLDDEGQEKFRLYLSSLGVNDSFVPAAYAAAHLHDEHAYHKWVKDVMAFTKQ